MATIGDPIFQPWPSTYWPNVYGQYWYYPYPVVVPPAPHPAKCPTCGHCACCGRSDEKKP